VHPGSRLRASWICPTPYTHPLPKCPLRTSVKTRFLVAGYIVAGIRVKFHRCTHPYSKSPLHASVLRSIKNWHSDPSSVTLVLLPGFYKPPQLEASFLICLTLGSIKQSNTRTTLIDYWSHWSEQWPAESQKIQRNPVWSHIKSIKSEVERYQKDKLLNVTSAFSSKYYFLTNLSFVICHLWITSHGTQLCVLLCLIQPILGNRYVQSHGFIVSEPRETHPRSEIADVPTLSCPPLDNLGCPDPHPAP